MRTQPYLGLITLAFVAACSTAPTTAPAVSAPAVIWRLDPGKTLQANIGEWASRAAWTVDWLASDAYSIRTPTELQGDFPAVLAKLADTTPLNICAFKIQRHIVITRPPIPCKD